MKAEQLVQLPLDRVICRKQAREQFDDGPIDELAATLKTVGQLLPIRVYREGEEFVVVDGERRLRAARKAGFGSIAAVVEDKSLSSPEILERQLVANAQRVDLQPLEKARAIAHLLKETGIGAQEAAARLGTSPASVSRLLALLTLPDTVLIDLEAGRIAASTAYELAKIDDPARQAAMARDAAEGRLTRETATKAARRAKVRSVPDEPAVKRAALSLEEGRSLVVQGPQLDYEEFLAACEAALAKAKKARSQRLSFRTFLKVARDQAAPGGA